MTPEYNSFQRLQVFQTLNRDWRGHLSMVERDFLSYLIDASVSWGREWIQVTVDQMLSGTEWGLPRVGLSRRSIFNALASLKEKGVIAVQRVSRKVSRYIVNLQWKPDMGLATPKNKETPEGRKSGLAVGKQRAESEVHIVHSEPENECIMCTPKIGSKKGEKDSSRRDAPDGVSGVQAIKAVKDRSTQKLRNSTNVEDVWRRGWIEGGYSSPAPGLQKKDLGQFGHVVRRFPDGLKIIEWGVANWSGVLARRFAWMTKKAPPKTPVPGFMLKFIDEFAEDFASAEDTKHRWAGTTEDREFQRLRQSGLSYEDALLEIGKRRAVHGEQDEVSKERAQIALARKALQIEAQQLEQQRRTMKPNRPAVKPDAPVINHGDNPWENGGGEVADFSSLGEWSDDE